MKTRHESQFPLSSRTEQHHRTARPVVYAYSPSCSEWNVDKTWSSQEWKSDELMDDKTDRPVVCSQRASQTRFSREYKNVILEEEENHDRTGRPVVCSQRAHQFVRQSRSFLPRVDNQVRKRQKQSSKDATKDSDKHSVIW